MSENRLLVMDDDPDVGAYNQFMHDMRVREDARSLVEGLIYLAHKLKMRDMVTSWNNRFSATTRLNAVV